MAGVWLSYMKSQLCFTPPYPTQSFTGQTIIVTGSNTGMGLEAARHFARLGAARLILAVRSQAKGDAAKKSIEETTSCGPGVVQVWLVDQASYASVAAFGERVNKELDRLDVVVGNAGILPYDTSRAEEDEATITVNVVNSLHHGILMLPKLRETAVRLGKPGVLTFTGSWMHGLCHANPHLAAPFFHIHRYPLSKVVQMLAIRALAEAVTASKKPGEVTVSVLNPGGVRTDITRDATGFDRFVVVSSWYMLWTAEVGGRTLVHAAASSGKEAHGQYLSNCAVAAPNKYVTSTNGIAAQRRIWKDLVAKLERLNPAVANAI
ncbi:putative short-chain dehydrogenase/reductase family protein [Microdochium trichocladiopsis]|uniref:Short-chain dehydrogenase/reductase family protein n=1 Tax=Microdochium trichocladiopsis TaxID=1682393 RepID=A0A9P8XTY2_9PEZI|nr:putative short-chain dehydrogenase/reductase family protein [Microdochium trichocladiopsis]KAH7018052.1 putative short-chain dehydrogenase/reductase family protein [Microdochium trichocladiopsis]